MKYPWVFLQQFVSVWVDHHLKLKTFAKTTFPSGPPYCSGSPTHAWNVACSFSCCSRSLSASTFFGSLRRWCSSRLWSRRCRCPTSLRSALHQSLPNVSVFRKWKTFKDLTHSSPNEGACLWECTWTCCGRVQDNIDVKKTLRSKKMMKRTSEGNE